MQKLIDRIKKDGIGKKGGIIKVDSFINHQMDTSLVNEIGKEFAHRFKDVRVDKILTIESSGIGIAIMCAIHMNNIPVVFAKKSQPNTMTENFYSSEVKSFTKGTVSVAKVTRSYLNPGENILIIDDFMAHGEAGIGLIDIVNQSGGNVVGVGAVIEKTFQGGGDRIRSMGYKMESLAKIKDVTDDGEIIFDI